MTHVCLLSIITIMMMIKTDNNLHRLYFLLWDLFLSNMPSFRCVVSLCFFAFAPVEGGDLAPGAVLRPASPPPWLMLHWAFFQELSTCCWLFRMQPGLLYTLTDTTPLKRHSSCVWHAFCRIISHHLVMYSLHWKMTLNWFVPIKRTIKIFKPFRKWYFLEHLKMCTTF